MATFFNEAVHKYDDDLKEGGVYTMSGGVIKSANKRYTSIKNDVGITFNRDSIVKETKDNSIQDIKDSFDFTTIKEIRNLTDNTRIDLLAIVV